MPSAPCDLQTHCAELAPAQHWMSEICGPHRLQAEHPQQLDFSHAGTRLPALGTVLGRIAYGTEVTIDIQSLDAYSISLPVRGRQRLRSRAAQVRSDAGLGLVVSPLQAQSLELGRDCEKLQVVIRRGAVEEVAQRLLRRPLTEPVSFRAEMDTHNEAVGAWWLSVRLLLDNWPGLSPLYGKAPLARDLEAQLIRGLLLAQPNNYSRDLAQDGQAHCPHYLTRAVEHVHAHARDELCLGDLERVAGVSREKLYDGFRRYHGLTPMAYLKHHRLQAARQALLGADPGSSVSAIALEWGFGHLGRFASDYRQTFGESPSSTLARLR